MKVRLFGFGLMFGLLTACGGKKSAVDVDEALAYCHTQVQRTLSELQQDGGVTINYRMMPRNIADTASTWHCREVSPCEWCGGFWPGILWYDYENTQDPYIRTQAERFTEALEPISEQPAFDHDLGFLMFCSYGNAYRLTHREDYRDVILRTAEKAATLFRPQVGTMLSWPRHVKDYGGHNTIMDNMINLEMMFWAARNGGDPQWRDMAVSHATKTMKYHFRPDYTSYHVAVYDTLTGDFIHGVTHQGYADDSMWARGQAWAIYGFTVVYRETQDPVFLDFVQHVADVYLQRLPADKVPYWDFNDPAIPLAPRDASAAAVVASALLELSTYVPQEKATYYRSEAEQMLTSLSSSAYRSGDAKPSFLLHSTGHHPAGTEIDYSIIYADYYYIEALLRLKKLQANQPLNE
jgi:unsaturated chondroitin disaccharide hydrolase